jgi:hypothetical protein
MTLITSEDASRLDGCKKITATIWAQKNGVKLVGGIYLWTQEEFETFKNRNKQRGRPRILKNPPQTV